MKAELTVSHFHSSPSNNLRSLEAFTPLSTRTADGCRKQLLIQELQRDLQTSDPRINQQVGGKTDRVTMLKHEKDTERRETENGFSHHREIQSAKTVPISPRPFTSFLGFLLRFLFFKGSQTPCKRNLSHDRDTGTSMWHVIFSVAQQMKRKYCPRLIWALLKGSYI